MPINTHTITLPDGRHYPILIGEDTLPQIGQLVASKRAVIITDTNVAPYWQAPLEASLDAASVAHQVITIQAGEASKSFATLQRVLDELLAMKPDRNTTLIALGGGVVGDLTGFAASILLRGVPFVQVPTSLLAQVDSSVGGKTGINTALGKNVIGSFYQPRAVVIDTLTLATLPERELRAGFAEIIKAALIADSRFFDWLEVNANAVIALDPACIAEAIRRSVAIKAEIVMQDEKESGIRALLNLGHTFGHALEVECAYDGRLVHGEAVAIGMAMAVDYAVEQGIFSTIHAGRLSVLLTKSGLPFNCQSLGDLNADRLLAHMQGDKKAENGEITLILPHEIGRAQLHKGVDAQSVLAFLQQAVT